MLRDNNVVSYILIQGVTFSTTLFFSTLTNIDYSLLLIIAGVLIMLITVPSGLELSSYARAAKETGRYDHEQVLNQLKSKNAGWLGIYGGTLMGLIPFILGIITGL